MKKHICPVCGYDELFDEPYDSNGKGSYEICPSCGFQFGYDDFPNREKQIESWRTNWKKVVVNGFQTCGNPKSE